VRSKTHVQTKKLGSTRAKGGRASIKKPTYLKKNPQPPRPTKSHMKVALPLNFLKNLIPSSLPNYELVAELWGEGRLHCYDSCGYGGQKRWGGVLFDELCNKVCVCTIVAIIIEAINMVSMDGQSPFFLHMLSVPHSTPNARPND